MKINEFDKVISEILLNEAKKIMSEQADGVNHLLDSVKNFQTLAPFLTKIEEIEDCGTDDTVIYISIRNVSPEELVHNCGGTSLSEAQRNLMQGLHHDLEDNGFSGSYDVDINTSGDESSLHLAIRITPNGDELSEEGEINEEPMDTNPTVDDKKNILLGGVQPEEVTEKQDKEKNTPTKMANESKKKVITLNESEMAELLKNIISEAVEAPITGTPSKGVPGLEVTNKAIKDSGKENDSALAAVEKKIKEYLSFKGNDKPEFPNQVGQGEEKVATQNTKEEDKEVDLNRGRGPQDLTYDQEPSKKFQERVKLSLVGASEMGNSQDAANVIKSKTGENMVKSMEARKKARTEEPLYKKEPVPTDESKDVPRDPEKDKAVSSDILRMKQMAEYKEKTQ